MISGEKLYYTKGLCSEDGGALFECEKDGGDTNKIMDNITDFTVEEAIILYVQSYANGDKHKIIEYHKDTGEKKTLMKLLKMYSDYGGRKIIFFDRYIIIPEQDTIGVYERKSKKINQFLQDDLLWNSAVSPFVFEGNCYISLIYYNDDYDLPIPPVERELTGIWKFDFKQNKLVQVSEKHACYSEIVGGELTLYNEFTFSPFLIKKYLMLFHPGLIYEKDSGL